jgi:hypothetical protein
MLRPPLIFVFGSSIIFLRRQTAISNIAPAAISSV